VFGKLSRSKCEIQVRCAQAHCQLFIFVAQRPNINRVEDEIRILNCVRCDLVTACRQKAFNRFLLSLGVARMRLRMPKVKLIRHAFFHQPPSNNFALDNLVFKLFDRQGIEIGMRVGMIAQNHSRIDPLLQQRNASIHLASRLQPRFIYKRDSRNIARLKETQNFFRGALSTRQIRGLAVCDVGEIVKSNGHCA